MAAATFDVRDGGTAGLLSPNQGQFAVISKQIDFAVTPLATDQSASLINIPAHCLVLGVQVYVDTIQGADTIDIGDADLHDYYMAVGSLAVANVTLWSDGAGAGTGRILVAAETKLYTAANDIRVTAHATAGTNGKITVRAIIMKLCP